MKMISALAVAALFATLATAAVAASGWRVVGKGSASGEYAVAAASGSAKHPHQMAVRLTGRRIDGYAVVACSKGFGVGSKTSSYKGAGLHLVKLPMGASDSCDVTASASGAGRVTVQILTR